MSQLTIEEIRDLVVAADRDRLCERMAVLTEDQRKALAPEALQLEKDIDKYSTTDKKIPDHLKELIERIASSKYVDRRCPWWTGYLLIVGLCDADHIKNSHDRLRMYLPYMQRRVLQILDVRRPKWLADWLKWEWKQEFPAATWYLERGLIRSGALPANDSPEYYARMADDTSVIDTGHTHTHDTLPLFPTRRAMFEADPDLFKHDIWRLFQVDSSAFRYKHLGWPALLMELCEVGHLDRERLLSESLKGLTLPLSVTTLAGMIRFHEQLKPTAQERKQLFDQYLRLFHVNNSTVVGLAMTAMEILHKEKQLPVGAFLQILPTAFLLDKKTPALSGIKLAMKIAQKDQALRQQVVQALVNALDQGSGANTAMVVIEALSKLKDSIDADSAARLEEYSSRVILSLRTALKKLLTEIPGATSSEKPKQAEVKGAANKAKKTAVAIDDTNHKKDKPSPKAANERSEFADIETSIRQDSDLDAALQAMQQNSPPIVLPVAKHAIIRRDGEQLVTPIADLDELIACVSAFTHKVDDVMELERILDGISRFHRERPDDFDKRVDPLRKRIAKVAEAFSRDGNLFTGLNVGLTDLITNWLEIQPLSKSYRIHWHTMRQWFLRERIYEVIERVEVSKTKDPFRMKETPVPMLALPTHQGGWIDPVVLVQRINTHYQSQQVHVEYYDLAQAILRLTPDGRREALGMLGEPSYYNGNNDLRYALGDHIDKKIHWGRDYVQVAAVRARMVSCANEGYQPEVPIGQASLGSYERILLEGALFLDPTVPFSLLENGFSSEPQAKARVHNHLSSHQWLDRWDAMSNPMDTDASCLAGHVSHLLDGEATWTPAACRLAVLAASNDVAEVRVLATDAVIGAIGRLLVIPEALGRAMAVNKDHIKLNRVTKALEDASNVSLLHHWVVFKALESYICEIPEFGSDIHLVLSLMLESALHLNTSLERSAIEKLKSLEGKSKSGKLASQLVRLVSADNSQQTIHAAIVEATRARAERWQNRLKNSAVA